MNKEEQHLKWQQDAKNWKLGFLYFNPDDPRIILPKRIKQLGWTINFGRWQIWMIFLVLALLALFKSEFSNN